jgi:hypothetical protein
MDAPRLPSNSPPGLSADRPISASGEDELGRGDFVRLVASQALSAPREAGFVLALTGAWGEGKTSVLQLVEAQLGDKVHVVRFNPWLFSGGDDLVLRFLVALAGALPGGRRTKALRDNLTDYSEVLAPLGGVAGAASGVASKLLKRSVEDRRVDICDALLKLDRRVVVVIDDIDRLAPPEVADIVRLVKLAGDFPNVTYLLAYDRKQVEAALDRTHGGSGRAYLDKIVQVSYPLPHVSSAALAAMLDTDVRERVEALWTAERPPQFSSRWDSILRTVIRPLLRTVRDVRRIANIAPPTAALIGEEVAAEDVVALEALRVLLPDVHDQLPGLAWELTSNRSYRRSVLGEGEDETKRRLTAFELAAGESHRQALRSVIQLLFPAADQHLTNNLYGPEDAEAWRGERRVATHAGLMTYLTKALGEHSVRAATVREAVTALPDAAAFAAILDDLPTGQLRDLLVRFRDELDPAAMSETQAAASIASLLSLMPRLPEERRTYFDIDAERLIVPLVRGLLSGIADAAERDSAAEDAFNRIESLYPRFRLLQWFGYRGQAEEELSDHVLLSARVTERLKERLREEFLQADVATWTQERQFRRMVDMLPAIADEAGRRRLAELVEDDSFLLSLLFAFSIRHGELDTDGTVIPRDGLDLNWEGLTERVSEDLLRRRVRELAAAAADDDLPEEVTAVLSIAAEYAGDD